MRNLLSSSSSKEVNVKSSTVTPGRQSSVSRYIFAPGDQVVRYVNGEPFFCTVINVEDTDRIRVSCASWPSGYSALVRPQDVVLVGYTNP
jgi:hypothetical protein